MRKGQKMSEEQKRKIGIANKGKKNLSMEKRKQISEKIKKLWADDSYRANQMAKNPERNRKISLANKGKPSWLKGKYGIIKHSEETKKKISEINRNRSPEIIEKMRQTKLSQHRHNSKEWQEHMRKVMKEKWKDIEYRNKVVNKMYGRKNTSGKKMPREGVEKRMAKMRIIMATPEYKEKARINRLKQIFPQKDSKPEKMLQLALDLAEIKYEKHKAITGQPDIFIEPNICIFVDGCYWHGCIACRGIKILDNEIVQKSLEKDQQVNEQLQNKGYIIMRIWEHTIMNSDSAKIIETIKKRMNFKWALQ